MHFKKVTTKITYGGIVKAHILRSDEKKSKKKKAKLFSYNATVWIYKKKG